MNRLQASTVLTISFILLFQMATFSQEEKKEEANATEIAPNTWVDAKLTYLIPPEYKTKSWSTTDGYCDSLYRSKTGSILIRTGIQSKELGLNPGYYSNTQLEWNLKTNNVEVIDVFKWGGGSGGGGKLLPGFKESPTPSPRHTYDGMAYVAEEDAMYFMCGANWKICLNPATTDEESTAQLKLDDNSTWKFTFADRKWTRIDGSIRQFWDGNRASPYESHLEYWPEGKKLLYFDSNARCYAEFDLKTQKWEKIELGKEVKPEVSLYGARTSWDSKRGLWIFRNGKNISTFNPKDKTFSALPPCWDLPPYPSKEKLEEMKKEKIEVDPRYGWKSIAYNSKLDAYVITGPTGNDTRAYHVEEKVWHEIKGGDIKLPNGYLEYDEKTDLFGLVIQHQAFKFRYVPVAKEAKEK
jgi:hypothetical protein